MCSLREGGWLLCHRPTPWLDVGAPSTLTTNAAGRAVRVRHRPGDHRRQAQAPSTRSSWLRASERADLSRRLDEDGQPVEVHLGVNNHSVHQRTGVKVWLPDHPRFKVHGSGMTSWRPGSAWSSAGTSVSSHSFGGSVPHTGLVGKSCHRQTHHTRQCVHLHGRRRPDNNLLMRGHCLTAIEKIRYHFGLLVIDVRGNFDCNDTSVAKCPVRFGRAWHDPSDCANGAC